jgi:hypothetical protein
MVGCCGSRVDIAVSQRDEALEELQRITNGEESEVVLSANAASPSSTWVRRSMDIHSPRPKSTESAVDQCAQYLCLSPQSEEEVEVRHHCISSRSAQYTVQASSCDRYSPENSLPTIRRRSMKMSPRRSDIELQSSQGVTEEKIFRIHNAIQKLLDMECLIKKKSRSRTDISRNIRDALVQKADMMRKACLVFDISQEAINAHYFEAAHYGFSHVEEREEALQKIFSENNVFTLRRLTLAQPALLETPKAETGAKPGVPNYLVWTSDSESSNCCWAANVLKKLKELQGVRVFSAGESSTLYQFTETPKAGVLYVKHPNVPALYIPSSEYQSYLFKETAWCFIEFLNYLGAVQVVFETGTETSLKKELSAAIAEGHVDISANIASSSSEAESTSITVAFAPKPKGYKIPTDKISRLPPYQRHKEWRDLQNLRDSTDKFKFTISADRSGLNKTSVALKIMQAGFEGSREKTKSDSREVKCEITFTPIKEYDSHATVSLDKSGYKRIQDLEESHKEMVLFADRYAKQYDLEIPDKNRVRLQEAMKYCSGVQEQRGFDFFQNAVYVNIAQGPDGLFKVLQFGERKTFAQFLEYSLPGEDQKFAPGQQAIVSEVVVKMLLLFHDACHMYETQYQPFPSSDRHRIFKVFLNVSDDLHKDTIAFARDGDNYLDLSRKPAADTITLMNDNWSSFFSESAAPQLWIATDNDGSPVSIRSGDTSVTDTFSMNTVVHTTVV